MYSIHALALKVGIVDVVAALQEYSIPKALSDQSPRQERATNGSVVVGLDPPGEFPQQSEALNSSPRDPSM